MAETDTRPATVATHAERHVTVWEWVVALISAAIVIASIGYVTYRAITNDRSPPDIVIDVERVVPTRSGYVVEVWVYNFGGITAKDLTVEAQLLSGGKEVMVRSVGFTFVPDGSRRKGGMFFPVDPRRHELRMYPVGYDYP